MSDNNNQSNTDTTSFASILAGVQKLRGEPSSNDSNSTPIAQQSPVTRQPQAQAQQPTVSSKKRTNAFNQDRASYNSPKTQPFQKTGSPKPSTISVNKTQTGNPLLQHIINVNWTYVESRNTYDYLVKNREVIFLSLKYHKLHPEYIQNKMKPLLKKNALLLTVVDIENSESILREINRICLFNGFTLLLAFNFEQAAKYLTYLATSV